MRILVVGAGMYVTGRSGSGVGTVLSSLAETSKLLPIDEVVVVARNKGNGTVVEEAVRRINSTLSSSLNVAYESVGADAALAIDKLCRKRRFDCAVVAVPDHLHFGFIRAAFDNGLHCLVVKPLTPCLGEAKKLVAMQKEYGLYGAVEFHKRFDETNLFVKKTLKEKRIGKILYFTVDYSQKISIPSRVFRKWAGKSNIFQYLGVHYVDLIYFLTGCMPIRALAVGTDGILRKMGIDTYDSVHATILWEDPENRSDNFVSQFSTNWIDPDCTSALSDQRYKVIGTLGRIECDQKNRGLELVSRDSGICQINPYFSEYLYGPSGEIEFSGYGHKSINLFLNDVSLLMKKRVAVDDLNKNRPSFKQALVSTAVIEMVNASLANRSAWRKFNEIF